MSQFPGDTNGPKNPTMESRSRVIAAIQGPIGLLALVALIAEGILGVLAALLEGNQRFYIALGMIVLLLGILGIVALYVMRGGALVSGQASGSVPLGGEVPITNEVFVAAAMAAHAKPEDYEASRKDVLKVVAALRAKTKGGVYYAGEPLPKTTDFEQAGMIATEDMRKVASSRYFLMIYPEKSASSVLMEAGVALAYERPSVYCVTTAEHLPYLLQRAVLDKNVKATAVTVTSIDQLVKMIEHDGLAMFNT